MRIIYFTAQYVATQCVRFTALAALYSTALVSILQITVSKTRTLTSTYYDVLGRYGTLLARALRGSARARKGVARGVAVAIGISLSIGVSPAKSGDIDAFKYNPKRYIEVTMKPKQALCLKRLIGKESAWNHKAIGNLNGTHRVYGLLQIKNKMAKDMNPMQQIQLHSRYINHRYDGKACNAWKHWQSKGWH